ncbi:MAG: type III-B CRISPR module RAMP protein Cmr1 [Betaproteobacteria bacterium]|nr:type III-B CRISPR module RAMP protein Cmr1 [Betaproteobacteria bacterium]
MNTLVASFRIVTPMFLGGVFPEGRTELREPSLKGALRFWWRALRWTKVKPGSSDEAALRELHSQESGLFGSAEGGQSSVLLRIGKHAAKAGRELDTGAGARYLGYGVMDVHGKLNRPCINAGEKFTCEFRSRGAFDTDFLNAIKLLGLLGGMGAKVRKGYGSLTLESLTGDVNWIRPTTPEAYVNEVSELLAGARSVPDLPPFSAFFVRTRVCLLSHGGDPEYKHNGTPNGNIADDPIAILDHFGRQMQRYRSWGYGSTYSTPGKVNGEDSEQNFPDDHRWFVNPASNPSFHPERIVFGLPHNYYSPQTHVKRDVKPNSNAMDRRASPLWFHVHDFGDGASPRYAGVASVFNSVFLPGGVNINAGGTPVAQSADYGVIDRFIDGGIGPAGAKASAPYFAAACKVFP